MKLITQLVPRLPATFAKAALLTLTLFVSRPEAFAQSANTATGASALANNTTGDGNSADGYFALNMNANGSNNTALGRTALFRNVAGDYNVAVGVDALRNDTGSYNTASGAGSLYNNINGSQNVATGAFALEKNINGADNTASGYFTLRFNTTGSFNTAFGAAALINTTGDYNIALGEGAGRNLTTGSRNIAIGADGAAGESNTIRVGKNGDQNRTFVAGIFGSTVPNGVQVVANAAGRLGTIVSSARFKEQIKPMNQSSETLLALQPVTFRYKPELDPDGIPQFGLVAEEVARVNPDLVIRDSEGKVNTVRYEAVNAMLLNEFLKEHRKVEEQEAAITGLQTASAQQQEKFESAIAAQQASFEARIAQQAKEMHGLASSLRKVSDRLEGSRPARQVAANNQ